MDTQKALRRLAHGVARIDLVPGIRKPDKARESGRGCPRIERTVAFKSGKCRHALDRRSPPYEHCGIICGDRLQTSC